MPATLLRLFASWLSRASAKEVAPVLEMIAIRLAITQSTSAEIMARRAAAAARQEGV